jgi:hypothetical protein
VIGTYAVVVHIVHVVHILEVQCRPELASSESGESGDALLGHGERWIHRLEHGGRVGLPPEKGGRS